MEKLKIFGMIKRRRVHQAFAPHIILLCIFLISGSVSHAQISFGGSPRSAAISQVKSTVKVPTFSSTPIDRKTLLEEDLLSPIPARFSVFEDVIIDIREEGLEIDMPAERGRIFLYNIQSTDARSIQLFFENFLLPDGGELFIYNKDLSIVRGAFTSANNNKGNQLMIANFPDNNITIEYFEPYNVSFEAFLELGSVGLAYKDPIFEKIQVDELGYVGINEPIGEDWQNEKHSVCKISYRTGGFGYICTGALLNNNRSDGIPYFLTANHCLDEEASAGTVVAYFNLEIFSGDGFLNDGQTLSGGSDMLLTSDITDFTLLKLNETPPASYQPYYAPWNATDDQDPASVGIHHPHGYPKRMSLDHSPPVTHDKSISWEGGAESAPNTHWKVRFDHGATAGGSSGSPLFNSERHQVIGQLHGGSEDDYYGKLSKTITLDMPKSIGSFLYPDDKDQVQLEYGYYPEGTLPDPQYYPEFAQVCIGTPIQLTGVSAFDPISWSWSFSPGTVTYTNGTDASSKAPEVQFESPGEYSVTLAVTNVAGTTTRSFTNSIVAGIDLDMGIHPYYQTDSCVNAFNSLVLEVYGAQEFLWSFVGEETDFYFVNDTVNPVIIKMNNTPGGPREISISMVGSHGSCSGSLNYTLPLFMQNNDSIKDAIQLFEGQSAVFSNKCASVEDNEPIPPITSCTGNSWCDEFGTGEDILGNSTWFYFIPDATGTYRIATLGMDNQIAVYSTASVDELLEGNYIFVGANDDSSDKNANPVVKVLLNEGEKYLVQVDGSAGNVSGEFYFTISMLSDVPASTVDLYHPLRIYPQPVSGSFRVEYEGFINSQSIAADVHNLSGSRVYSYNFEQPTSRVIDIDASQWENGIYFVRFRIDGTVITEKVLKF